MHYIQEMAKKQEETNLTLKFVDERLLSTPPIALMQVKKEIEYMISLVEENAGHAFNAIETGSSEYSKLIRKNEEIIDFTNSELTKFLIKLSVDVEESDENTIGSYFHVLNDLERIGDHAENFHEIGLEMIKRNIVQEYDGTNIRTLAIKYNYSEKSVRRIIKESLEE